MSHLEVQRLFKNFGDVKAVDDVSFEARDGELLVLVGPSGCGKTTTLRLIAGLDEASGGVICMDGLDVSNFTPGQRNLGMVFQNYALYPHKTVYENLSFGLKIRKVSKPEIAQLINDVSQRLKIHDLYKRYPSQISGGQKQRVALARALLRGSNFLLFDEPLSNLDAALRQEMRLEIAGLHRERKFTGIYVTHDQTEAMTLGSRIAVMDRGKIVQLGTPQEVYNTPANTFVASFIGTPGMNIFSGQTTGGTFQSKLFSVPAPSACYSVGIRPEHLIVKSLGEFTFETTVRQPELCGFDWLLHLEDGTRSFCCRSKESALSGDVLVLSFSAENLHFFDQSGTRIS
jgi:ABC-type sugar transport system ATPase subunit